MAENGNGKTAAERWAGIVRDIGIPAAFAFLLLLWLPPMRDAIRDLSSTLVAVSQSLRALTTQQERTVETQRQIGEELRTHRALSERAEVRSLPEARSWAQPVTPP